MLRRRFVVVDMRLRCEDGVQNNLSLFKRARKQSLGFAKLTSGSRHGEVGLKPGFLEFFLDRCQTDSEELLSRIHHVDALRIEFAMEDALERGCVLAIDQGVYVEFEGDACIPKFAYAVERFEASGHADFQNV